RIRQVGHSHRLAACACSRHDLAGLADPTHGRETLLDLPACRDGAQGRADRGLSPGCLFIGTPQGVSFAPSPSVFADVTGAPFAISLVFVMYSFSGWNAATYIIGEMDTPQRSLPRALLAGTVIVMVLYVALNAVFLHTAPIDKLAGQLDVAVVSGRYIFGDVGGRIVAAMICIGLISSISAMMWIGPRVMMTMGEDIPAIRMFARKSKSGAPAFAILFQLAVSTL